MARRKSFWGMLAAMLAFGAITVGCASLTWNSPVRETGSRRGLETALQNAGAQEVARYTRIFGFIPLGRGTFDGLVTAAARSGQSVHVLRRNGLFVQRTVAYATTPGGDASQAAGNVIIIQ